jgi:hypothetical protein
MQINNLIIEKNIKNVLFGKKLLITIDWNNENPIGTANAYYDDKGNIVADIVFTPDISAEQIVGLYPAIGYFEHDRVSRAVSLSFCHSPNQDPSIQPVSIEDFYIPFNDQPDTRTNSDSLDRHWLFTIAKVPINHPDQVTYTTGTLENVHPFQHMTKLSKASSAYQYSLVLCEEITPFDYKLFFH